MSIFQDSGGRTMSIANGHSKESGAGHAGSLAPAFPVSEPSRERLVELIAELEIPFDPSVIEWRVTNTNQGQQESSRSGDSLCYPTSLHGPAQCAPYSGRLDTKIYCPHQRQFRAKQG